MPRNEHLVLCGGTTVSRLAGAKILELNLHGHAANVRLQIQDISKRLLTKIPDELADLLEVATYIYAADAAVSRGGKTDYQMGARWRRKFKLVIPVRLPDLWCSNAVIADLVETLSFLSEDEFEFDFRKLNNPPILHDYFRFSHSDAAAFRPDAVMLFSGGLDSLAGALNEIVGQDRKVALVSHRSASKIASAQLHLVDELRGRFGKGQLLHVPVWANLERALGQESTHRTRSFLFAALGAVTAHLFDIDRIRFFENGVVSLNLPPAAQVVGARATRSTHPQALAGFGRVLGAVLGRSFAVENPFAWLTKSDVLKQISASGGADLIRHTRSCTRVHDMTRLNPHCGECSQCIDRRFAVLATSLQDEDPAEAYGTDLFTGERHEGPDREMALAFVRSASNIDKMSEVDFFTRYGETSRIVSYFPETADAIAGRIFDLYRRHAKAICDVFDDAIRSFAADLRRTTLPPSCLLTLVIGQGGVRPYPEHVHSVEVAFSRSRMIRLGVDDVTRCVVLDEWGRIKGVSADLLIALAQPFRQAVHEELAPEEYPFMGTSDLMDKARCNNDATLRRRVLRCRNDINRLATRAGNPAPGLDAVIESLTWHGYRLNPDSVRLVAPSTLSAS